MTAKNNSKEEAKEKVWENLLSKHENIIDILSDKKFRDLYNFSPIKTEQLLDKCIKLNDFVYLNNKFFSLYILSEKDEDHEKSKKLIKEKTLESFNKNLHKINTFDCENVYNLLAALVVASEQNLLLLRIKKVWFAETRKLYEKHVKDNVGPIPFEELFEHTHKDDPVRDMIAGKVNSLYSIG